MDPHGPAARVGRDGTLSLRAERRGTATVLAGCRFTLPLQVLSPLALDDDALVVSILNPTGSVLAGDRLRISLHAGPEARVLVTTPSATKVCRSDGPMATQDVDLIVERDAMVEWVPDHTIPFRGAAYRQRLTARVGPGATLVVVDAFAAGRVAAGETWRFARLESTLSIADGDGWLLHDRLALTGDQCWAGLGFTEGLPYFATVAAIAPVDAALLAQVTADAAAAVDGARIGVAVLPRGGVLVRCLAEAAPALSAAVQSVWGAVRGVVVGTPPLELRKY